MSTKIVRNFAEYEKRFPTSKKLLLKPTSIFLPA